MIEELETIAFGELRLKPEEYGNMTVGEIDAMYDGYKRREYQLDDLLIFRVALPVYQSMMGSKDAPTYEQLTAYRRKQPVKAKSMDPALAEKWRKIYNVEIPGIEKGTGGSAGCLERKSGA